MLLDVQTKQREIPAILAEVQAKQRAMEQELKRLALKMDDDGGGGAAAGEGDGVDHKKLKERLKKALKLDEDPLSKVPKEPTAWLAFLFGIRAADQRRGKEGSRCAAQIRSL